MFVLTGVQVSRGSMFWLLKGQIFGRRRAVTAPDTSSQMIQEACIIGGMRPLSTHGAAAGRAATQKEIKRITLRPSHRGVQAFLRSNRLTHFLWLQCPLCLSSWTATAKAGGRKKNPQEDVGVARPAGGSLHHHERRHFSKFWSGNSEFL